MVSGLADTDDGGSSNSSGVDTPPSPKKKKKEKVKEKAKEKAKAKAKAKVWRWWLPVLIALCNLMLNGSVDSLYPLLSFQSHG